MSLPSTMFVAGDIIQTILRTFFLGRPVVNTQMAIMSLHPILAVVLLLIVTTEKVLIAVGAVIVVMDALAVVS